MRFKHHCNRCISLGEYGNADLYFCNLENLAMVYARYSDESNDYTSGGIASILWPDLAEARYRTLAFMAASEKFEEAYNAADMARDIAISKAREEWHDAIGEANVAFKAAYPDAMPLTTKQLGIIQRRLDAG